MFIDLNSAAETAGYVVLLYTYFVIGRIKEYIKKYPDKPITRKVWRWALKVWDI